MIVDQVPDLDATRTENEAAAGKQRMDATLALSFADSMVIPLA